VKKERAQQGLNISCCVFSAAQGSKAEFVQKLTSCHCGWRKKAGCAEKKIQALEME